MNEHGNNLLLELLQVQEPHQSNGGERHMFIEYIGVLTPRLLLPPCSRMR